MQNKNQKIYQEELANMNQVIKSIGTQSSKEQKIELKMIGNLKFFDQKYKKIMTTEDFTMSGLKEMNELVNEIHTLFDINNS